MKKIFSYFFLFLCGMFYSEMCFCTENEKINNFGIFEDINNIIEKDKFELVKDDLKYILDLFDEKNGHKELRNETKFDYDLCKKNDYEKFIKKINNITNILDHKFSKKKYHLIEPLFSFEIFTKSPDEIKNYFRELELNYSKKRIFEILKFHNCLMDPQNYSYKKIKTFNYPLNITYTFLDGFDPFFEKVWKNYDLINFETIRLYLNKFEEYGFKISHDGIIRENYETLYTEIYECKKHLEENINKISNIINKIENYNKTLNNNCENKIKRKKFIDYLFTEFNNCRALLPIDKSLCIESFDSAINNCELGIKISKNCIEKINKIIKEICPYILIYTNSNFSDSEDFENSEDSE